MVFRFLNSEITPLVHKKFVHAFSDYVLPFNLTEQQFHNHILLNAVELERSLGCFIGDEMVGFTLNGFGDWNGLPTVYDAGTGVIPDFRRRGISEAMFGEMLPKFKDAGYRQILLEVVTKNEPAVRLYEKLGFRCERELLLLESSIPLPDAKPEIAGLEIRLLEKYDPDLLRTLWDGLPSWQNSAEAITRTTHLKKIFGAFNDGEIVGYIVFSSGVGRLAQLAVKHGHRQKGIAARLLREMQADMAEGYKLQVINLDSSITDAAEMFKKYGFKEVVRQYEMIKTL